MTEPRSFDVVIVGGGIAGLTLACLLRDSDFHLALIEHTTLPAISEQAELRVSAIGRAAMQVFENSAALDSMLHERATPFREMHVWDATGAGEIHFDSAEMGLETLGYIIENIRIQHALHDVMQSASNIEMFCPVGIDAIEQTHGGHAVKLDNGEVLDADLLVGADGVRSQVRRYADIAFQSRPYQQQALVCTTRTEYSHQQTAWQIFLPTGPLAFLPMFTENGNDQCSIVWSLPVAEAERLLAVDEQSFIDELEQAFQYKLGTLQLVGERASFPLQHGHVDRYIRPGLALIGDAAHIIHPLAGQGANLGVLDAHQLAAVILQAKRNGRKWSAEHTLRAYERARKGDNRVMETAMSGFNRLFSNDDPWLSLVRNAGLNMVDHAPFIKQQFMQHAMGV